MTPAEELGYKVGDQFIVLSSYDGSYFEVGETITLYKDDNSSCPWFWSDRLDDYYAIELHDVEPFSSRKSKYKISKEEYEELLKQVDTAHITRQSVWRNLELSELNSVILSLLLIKYKLEGRIEGLENE